MYYATLASEMARRFLVDPISKSNDNSKKKSNTTAFATTT